MKIGNALAAGLAIALLPAMPVLATEGGSGHYLLGSRDALSGIVPPPGVYTSADMILLNANVDALSIGGVVLANADTEVLITKLNFTKTFPGPFLGARPMITITQPVVTGTLSFDSVVLGAQRRVEDNQTGLGDTTVTFGLGWDKGANHFAFATSFFLPLGYFQPAAIDVPGRQLTALSFGKNRLGVTPVISYTHMPKSGFELSGAAGISFSARNQATDYQTAPEFHFEGAALQHFGPRFALGAAGYAYQQLGEDSGSGAEQLKAATGAQSLKARVFGIGPVATYATKIGGTSLSLKAKYTHEFEARRRFSGDSFQLSVALGF